VRTYSRRVHVIFSIISGEAECLLPHLFQFTPHHRAEGKSLQTSLAEFELELIQALDEIWKQEVDGVLTTPNPATQDKRREVAKPEVIGRDWRVMLFDMDS
jgi:elongator complex protein 1